MTEERWIEEIAKEIERLESEMEFIEIEYSNYIKELQYMNDNEKEFSCIIKTKKVYPYDMEALKEKYKDKIAKGIRARF